MTLENLPVTDEVLTVDIYYAIEKYSTEKCTICGDKGVEVSRG